MKSFMAQYPGEGAVGRPRMQIARARQSPNPEGFNLEHAYSGTSDEFTPRALKQLVENGTHIHAGLGKRRT